MNIDRSGWDAAEIRIREQRRIEADIQSARDELRENVTWKSDSHIDASATKLVRLLESISIINFAPIFAAGSVLRERIGSDRRWVACQLWRTVRGTYMYDCRLEGSPDGVKGVVTFAEHELERA